MKLFETYVHISRGAKDDIISDGFQLLLPNEMAQTFYHLDNSPSVALYNPFSNGKKGLAVCALASTAWIETCSVKVSAMFYLYFQQEV